MPENQQNYTKVVPNSSNGEEAIEYPKREGEPDCDFYLRKGWCGYRANCRYNHPPFFEQSDESKSMLPQREGQPDCGYFIKTGTCNFGSSCRYHHPLDRRGAEVVILNSLGLPLRKLEKPCPFYTIHQKCKFGAACKFNHPEPTPVETALPVSEASSAVGIGSSLHSTAIPFVGAYPGWPWTSSSYFPGPQAYMPYIIPHMQGAIATQNWNSYLGYMSSSAASNVVGTDLIYASKYQGGQGNLSTMTSSNLPERPDQPECRYFMKNGGCKFGSECKYHHPKEQIAHSLAPRGLPLRPGDDIYANFNSYGYISGYYFGMPSVAVPNQPYFPSQRNLLISSSTETSQSKSSKITDWIQKPETVESKSHQQHSVTKPVEDSLEKVDDHSNACTEDSHEKVVEQSNAANGATDEISRDQSN